MNARNQAGQDPWFASALATRAGPVCDAWTERIAVLYRAHHALAATAPGTDAHERAQAAGSGRSPTSMRIAYCRPPTRQRAC
jgi:hypothetical protein